MRDLNQILASPNLHQVVAQARAAHSPKTHNAHYAQLKRLADERTAAHNARIKAERLQELYEMSGLVFMVPSLNPYGDD